MRTEAAATLRSATGARRWWASGVGLAGLLLLGALVVHLPALRADPWNSDEAYLATQAQVLNHGGALYLDTADRKPPVVPLVYTAAFRITGSDELLWVRLLAIAAWLLALEATRRFTDRRAGLVAGLLLLGSGAAFYPKDVQTASFEVFMLPAMIGAVMLARRRRSVGAGLAVGVGTLVKQTAAFTLLPVAFLVGRRRAREEPSRSGAAARIRALAFVGLGFLAPILIAAVLFGPGRFSHWMFLANDRYLDVSGALGYTARLGFRQTGYFLLAHAAVVVLAAVTWRHWRDDADLWLWVGSGALAGVSGFRFFGHYYLEVLPPVCLLATRAALGVSRRTLVLVAASIALTVGLFAIPALGASRGRTQQVGVDLAAYARAHTRAGARILVWGHLPEVYWRSGRLPATRFATTGFLTGQTGGRPPDRAGMQYAASGAWDDFDTDVTAHPPALVFDLAPADIRNSRFAPPAKFPRFGRVLARCYRRVGTVDGVIVYAPR